MVVTDQYILEKKWHIFRVRSSSSGTNWCSNSASSSRILMLRTPKWPTASSQMASSMQQNHNWRHRTPKWRPLCDGQTKNRVRSSSSDEQNHSLTHVICVLCMSIIFCSSCTPWFTTHTECHFFKLFFKLFNEV